MTGAPEKVAMHSRVVGDTLSPVNAWPQPRAFLALVVTGLASVASIASLDEAAPLRAFTGTLPERSAVLTETSGPVPVKLHVTSSQELAGISLTIQLTASWVGFAEGAGGGTPDQPIVEATLDGGAGGSGSKTLDRAITTAPGTGALTLVADASCKASSDGCSADFTFTLDRIEKTPSGPVSVRWTPTAQIISDAPEPVVEITVVPRDDSWVRWRSRAWRCWAAARAPRRRRRTLLSGIASRSRVALNSNSPSTI